MSQDVGKLMCRIAQVPLYLIIYIPMTDTSYSTVKLASCPHCCKNIEASDRVKWATLYSLMAIILSPTCTDPSL
jgi:hypothetical protein